MANLSWAVLGLALAVVSALMMLMQERMKVEGFVLAVWCKVACVLVTLPLVLMYGLPSDWRFYVWLVPQALLFTISDVLMFRHLPEVGAGVISRLMPATVITSFFLWFAVAPHDLQLYMGQPVLSLMIILVLCGAGFFASRLRKCAVSSRAVRLLWFVLLASTIGPLLAKITTRYASAEQGAVGFTFAEALMMLAMWLVWLVVKRPVPYRDMIAKKAIQKSLLIGVVTASMVLLNVAGFYFVDNPGYISALQLVYAAIIIAAHKWMGKKDESDVFAGLGIVACAMALIVLKAQLG